MKKGKIFIVLALLMVASLMAAVGSGAIDVFNANRSSAMTIVNDSKAYLALSTQSQYAYQTPNGQLKLDFTESNPNVIGDGFNPQANSEFNKVFSVTNQSAKTIYVWLEAEGWSSQHNAGLRYRVGDTTGLLTTVDEWYRLQPAGRDLLSSTGMNFVSGVGKMAYVKLAPGETFDVNLLVNTVLGNGYGDANTHYSNWGHKVIVKASATAPTQNGQYNKK